jgi:cell division protein FtsQ
VIQVEKAKKRPPPRPPVLRDPPRVIRSKIRFFVVLSLFFAIAGGLYWFVRSDHFAVASIEVRGQTRLSADKIIESTGLVVGVNIWQVDVSRLEDHLLENRRIRSVFVQKYLPDTIVIQINEYGPLALIPAADGFAEIDENQTVMGFLRTIGSLNLPIITGIELAEPVPGEVAFGPHMEDAVACALATKNETFLGLVEIHVDETGQVTMVTQEGIRIIIGSYGEGFQKVLDVVEPILLDIRTTQSPVLYIDMRAPDKPVVKLK